MISILSFTPFLAALTLVIKWMTSRAEGNPLSGKGIVFIAWWWQIFGFCQEGPGAMSKRKDIGGGALDDYDQGFYQWMGNKFLASYHTCDFSNLDSSAWRKHGEEEIVNLVDWCLGFVRAVLNRCGTVNRSACWIVALKFAWAMLIEWLIVENESLATFSFVC